MIFILVFWKATSQFLLLSSKIIWNCIVNFWMFLKLFFLEFICMEKGQSSASATDKVSAKSFTNSRKSLLDWRRTLRLAPLMRGASFCLSWAWWPVGVFAPRVRIMASSIRFESGRFGGEFAHIHPSSLMRLSFYYDIIIYHIPIKRSEKCTDKDTILTKLIRNRKKRRWGAFFGLVLGRLNTGRQKIGDQCSGVRGWLFFLSREFILVSSRILFWYLSLPRVLRTHAQRGYLSLPRLFFLQADSYRNSAPNFGCNSVAHIFYMMAEILL